VYLLWLLGYNFSVAVWVGFIALFGTAVQTGVVMVIYLEEAVERKRRELGPAFTRAALRDAVVEGALLRLRPKVMTVSTVVAGLLPIMWSTQPGAEVMKPLATPVLGGMVSSLVHVLVVTPVIFYLLRARQMGAAEEEPSAPAVAIAATPARSHRLAVGASLSVVAVAAIAVGAFWMWPRAEDGPDAVSSREGIVQTVRAGALNIVLRSPTGTLRQGRNVFTIEFQESDGRPVDVGAVRATANMTMPGMVMSGGLEVARTTDTGRYEATAEFGMAGAWRIAIDWDGAAGRGSISFEGTVQ